MNGNKATLKKNVLKAKHQAVAETETSSHILFSVAMLSGEWRFRMWDDDWTKLAGEEAKWPTSCWLQIHQEFVKSSRCNEFVNSATGNQPFSFFWFIFWLLPIQIFYPKTTKFGGESRETNPNKSVFSEFAMKWATVSPSITSKRFSSELFANL